ncbi:MAG: hypothetical protein ABSH14_01545 [Verrucomicrobiia bacterium]
MSRLFSLKLRKLLLHSVQHFVIAIVIFAMAIALTYLEDYCVEHHRPAWLVFGVQMLSIWMFIVDCIVVGSIVAIVGVRSIREFAAQSHGG